jgi:hypothetical protein
VTDFVLDFGDGTTENNSLSGTHSYPANFVVDPILTVNNETCSEVISGLERETPRQTELKSPLSRFNLPPPVAKSFMFKPPAIIIPLSYDDVFISHA